MRSISFAAASLIVLAVTACSSSDESSSSSSSSGSPGKFASSGGTGGGTTSGGGTSGGTTSGGTTSGGGGGGGGSTVDQCISACEAKYPNGAKKAAQIDACWASSCSSCENMTSDGHVYGPTRGSCKTDVKTPSAACSTCTTQSCCAAWDACFLDAECVALNQCSVACYQ